MEFLETKRVEQPISDMRVHIDYQAQMSPPWLPPTKQNNQFVFKRGYATEAARQTGVTTGTRSQMSTIFKLDAFKVRDAFHALDAKDVDAVLAFLNATGAFWRLDDVTSEQIEEWQEFSKQVHCNNVAEMPLRVRSAMSGYPQKFFHESYNPGYDAATVLSEVPRDPILRPCRTCGQPFHFDRREDAERGLNAAQRSRHGIIFELVQWFWCPPKGMLLIYPPFRKSKQQGALTDSPQAEIEAINVLEAVAACAWVERFDGVQYRKCKLDTCRGIFRVESGHNQMYCPDRSCAATDRKRKERRILKKKAAALERAMRKKKAAAKVAQKNPSAIQRPKTTFKRGTK